MTKELRSVLERTRETLIADTIGAAALVVMLVVGLDRKSVV